MKVSGALHCLTCEACRALEVIERSQENSRNGVRPAHAMSNNVVSTCQADRSETRDISGQPAKDYTRNNFHFWITYADTLS